MVGSRQPVVDNLLVEVPGSLELVDMQMVQEDSQVQLGVDSQL